jgi:hypothetical protein
MIKPELVEIGGGFHKSILVLNPDYRTRLFDVNMGTSFSSPIIANYLARLMNSFPTYSRNLIIALLISSARIPKTLPSVFPIIDSKPSVGDFLTITNVYGYGKPNFDEAKDSDDNYVVFKYAGSMPIDNVRYFTIQLPEEFIKEKGDKEISATLVFDPPIRAARADYFGTRMEYHLFRDHSLEEVQEKYNKSVDLTVDTADEDEDGKVPEELSGDELKFTPGTNLRKKTTHQKGIFEFSRYKIDPLKPLVLAVVCQKKWDMDEETQQDFAVVITVRHSKEVDLYNKIKTLNQAQVQPEVRPQVRV